MEDASRPVCHAPEGTLMFSTPEYSPGPFAVCEAGHSFTGQLNAMNGHTTPLPLATLHSVDMVRVTALQLPEPSPGTTSSVLSSGTFSPSSSQPQLPMEMALDGSQMQNQHPSQPQPGLPAASPSGCSKLEFRSSKA